MHTRCPYADCLEVFEAPQVKAVPCPRCGREASVKPLDVWLHIDKQHAKLSDRGKLADAQTLAAKLSVVETQNPSFIAALEDVRSLWNVGSIFRSADGAGCGLLMLSGITGTPPRKEILKTSLGAEETMPWLYTRSLTEVLPSLRVRRYQIVGLEVTAGMPGVPDSVPLKDALAQGALTAPVCLLVGNEVTGLSLEALRQCDLVCHLPMRGVKESLNVAVAFGIAAYMLADLR